MKMKRFGWYSFELEWCNVHQPWSQRPRLHWEVGEKKTNNGKIFYTLTLCVIFCQSPLVMPVMKSHSRRSSMMCWHFAQLYDFLKLHKESTFNSNMRHTLCLCEICEHFLFSHKCWTIERWFSEKSYQPAYMTWQKNSVATLTRVIICLKNVHFLSHLKLLIIWN